MKLLIILFPLMLGGCVSLEMQTKYGAFKAGTNGESLSIGYSK